MVNPPLKEMMTDKCLGVKLGMKLDGPSVPGSSHHQSRSHDYCMLELEAI